MKLPLAGTRPFIIDSDTKPQDSVDAIKPKTFRNPPTPFSFVPDINRSLRGWLWQGLMALACRTLVSASPNRSSFLRGPMPCNFSINGVLIVVHSVGEPHDNSWTAQFETLADGFRYGYYGMLINYGGLAEGSATLYSRT